MLSLTVSVHGTGGRLHNALYTVRLTHARVRTKRDGASVRFHPLLSNVACAVQARYLITNEDSVTLSVPSPSDTKHCASPRQSCPDALACQQDLPFVSPDAPPRARWKHLVFRAFAQRHVLPLAVAAGTAAERSALASFYAALPALLRRVCDGGLGALGGLGTDVDALSSFDAEVLHELDEQYRCAFSGACEPVYLCVPRSRQVAMAPRPWHCLPRCSTAACHREPRMQGMLAVPACTRGDGLGRS
jgi:hypothetical protein